MAQLIQKSLSPSLTNRLKWWRVRFVPITVWILAVIIGIFLSSRKSSDLEIMGIIEAQDVPVTLVQDGKIQELTVNIYDPVQKGQTLALMEDTSLRTELVLLESDLHRLSFEWESKKDQWEKNRQSSNEIPLSRMNELKAQLDYTKRSVMRVIDKQNLSKLGMLLERQKRLMDEKITGPELYERLKLEMASLSEAMINHGEMLDVFRNRIQEAQKQSGNNVKYSKEGTWDGWIRAFREEIAKNESLLQSLAEKSNSFEISAPLSGVVSKIFYKPGDNALSGNPLLTILGSDSVKAIAYVKEDQFLDIPEGSAVTVYSRIRSKETFNASVLKVGPQMEEIPIRLRRALSFPEWGLPIVVGNLPFDMFRPGEVVEIHISNVPVAREDQK